MSIADSRSIDIPGPLLELLFAQWINTYATAELNTTQYGKNGDVWEFSRQPEGDGFKVQSLPDAPGWSIETRGSYEKQRVEDIVRRAAEAVYRRDLGGSTCYCSSFTSSEPDIISLLTLQFMRNLGDQVCIDGWRRLSDVVLLEFVAPKLDASTQQLLVPKTEIRVLMFVPGGSPGPLSDKLASDVLEFVRVICTFALGRPVGGSIGRAFPADSDQRQEAEDKRYDAEILTLAGNHVSLDPFKDLLSLGGPSSILRYRNSLVAFDAAVTQLNPDVATILFVSGIEALLSPDAPWRKSRLVTRFVKAVLEYAPETVEQILRHGNMKEAFDFTPTGGPRNQGAPRCIKWVW